MKFGKLPTLPWYLRLVAFLFVGGAMYFAFFYFVTGNTRKETKTMEDEIARLRPLNAQAQIVSQNLNNFKAIYKAREEEFAELKALLPEQRELTMVLQGIQDRARSNGLVLSRFNPKEDIQQDNYSGKKIEVSVVSGFTGLRAFFPPPESASLRAALERLLLQRGHGRLLTLHFFLGMLLLGPVCLKVGSTLWRFTRYYTGSAAYVRHM